MVVDAAQRTPDGMADGTEEFKSLEGTDMEDDESDANLDTEEAPEDQRMMDIGFGYKVRVGTWADKLERDAARKNQRADRP